MHRMTFMLLKKSQMKMNCQTCVPEASQKLIDIEISVEKGSNSSLKVHIRL